MSNIMYESILKFIIYGFFFLLAIDIVFVFIKDFFKILFKIINVVNKKNEENQTEIDKEKQENNNLIKKIKNARNGKYDICSFKKSAVEKPINNIFKKNIFHINENIEKISKININDFVKNKDLKDI